MNGIIIINKPPNYTSFDIVAVMRKLINEKKIGHAGTLDPMATGVLPIFIGRATKIQQFMPKTNKEYIAEFKLGLTTDTLDITGNKTSSMITNVKEDEIKNILDKFVGNISQVPPMYSAIQKNGTRLYHLARKGIEVTRESRKVTINELRLLNFNKTLQKGTLLINCSKGTYIRTLCDDIGKQLGCGAVLSGLQRIQACGFNIKDSITLDEIKNFVINKKLDRYIVSCDAVFKNLIPIYISSPQAVRFKNGGSLNLQRISTKNKLNDGELIRIYNQDIGFIGLGKVNLKKNELSVACLINI